jgi:3-deoxy-manno-octulosonate cytidylyltransferase (CMP-KDO synthetase)
VSLPENPVILIPARLKATRLPRKPLADIHGEPMIVHVWRRAVEAGLGPVYVACGEEETAQAVKAAGGNAVMTDPDLPSGSDRIYQALGLIDPEKAFDAVINFQGDLPTIDPQVIRAVLAPLAEAQVDIATLAFEITEPREASDPNVVKAVISLAPGAKTGRALYFTRALAPGGKGPLYHHIGLYAYRRAALEKFESLAPAPLEVREKLEQLRALEAGMRIDVALVDRVPPGVDTPEDLEHARTMLAPGNNPFVRS